MSFAQTLYSAWIQKLQIQPTNLVVIIACFLVFLWIIAATVFYRLIDNGTNDSPPLVWSWADSFYYSIQTGLSIGFGLLHETKDSSRIFSCINVGIGSSLIAGALALFASLALTRQSSWQTTAEQQLTKYAASINVNGYAGMDAKELMNLMFCYPHYLKDLYIRTEEPQAACELLERFEAQGNDKEARKQMIFEALKRAHEKLPEFSAARVTVEELSEALEPTGWRGCLSLLSGKRNLLTMLTAFIIWVIIGVAFGMTVERWSFPKSLYFAITVLSTAGMQAVTRTDGHVFFVAIYAFIGVPIYGLALGTLANEILDSYNQQQLKEKMNNKLDAAEVQYVEHLLDNDTSSTVTMAEYIEIQLLRLGIVNRDTLERLKEEFRKLDKDDTGIVDKEEFMPLGEKRMMFHASRQDSRLALSPAAAERLVELRGQMNIQA